MLSLLKAGGVGDQAAAYAADLLSMYVTATAYEQSLYAELYSDPEHEKREVARIAERFAAVSPERFPTIAALRTQLTSGDSEERFALGIDVLVNGLLRRRPRGADASAGRGSMSEQWFVVNVGDADWESKGEFGVRTRFESPDDRFAHFGITVQVLRPGQPSGLYHAEEAQEGFLVLAGECLAVIDGRGACPAPVGLLPLPRANAPCSRGRRRRPCAVLMLGAPRSASLPEILYPEDPVAARHGASVAETTRSSKQAYADRTYTGPSVRAPWPDA